MILEQMLSIREKLMNADRNDVIKKLMWRLHYEVAQRVQAGDAFILFASESDMNKFCHNNNLDIRALKSVINSMREEGLLTPEVMPVNLSPLGVEKLCVN